MNGHAPPRLARAALLAGFVAACGLALLGCEGDSGSPGLPGQPAPLTSDTTALHRDEDLPGVVVGITAVSSGTGPGGNLRPGDTLSVTFTLQKGDGDPLLLEQLDSGGILLSGPTFNYQPVIPLQRDLLTRAKKNLDGSYTYTFPAKIPATYPAPENDTPSFGLADGELQGQALLAGTYTVGIQVYKTYTVLTEEVRDAFVTTRDVLLGASTTLERREVVKNESCNQCHVRLQAHGGSRLDVRYCVLCHTSGAEDKNVASAAGGTPGASIDFRVMIHKIHAGSHLPSVLGVGTKADGTRDYAATKTPYRLVGFQNSVHDYSDVGFPVFPNLNTPMPRDAGYAGLAAGERSLEDAMRRGPTACAKCHGDPDGAGPLTAPAQGAVAYSQPSRRACGACHDDIDWTRSYAANGQTMPPQAHDQDCATCHPPSAALAAGQALPSGVKHLASLAVEDPHRHPLNDPAVNTGTVVDLVEVKEAGTNDGDGRLDAGEEVEIAFTVKLADGTPVAAADINRVSFVLVGPKNNRQMLLNRSALPSGALTGLSQPYRLNLMADVKVEHVGDATGAAQTLSTALDGHWHSKGASTSVREVTGLTGGGGSSTASAATVALQNYVDVAAATNFAKDDYVVIDRATASREYARVALVDGLRLWLTYPLRKAHASAATVEEVTTAARAATTTYTLNEPSGTLNLVAGQFTAGNAVLVDYTGDYRLPSVYPPPLNDSPDLGQAQGEWRGLNLVSGTYQLGVFARRSLTLMSGDPTAATETNSYSSVSLVSQKDVVVVAVNTTTDVAPVIPKADDCYRCHDDLLFHGGGRRGYDTCLLCHGTAGPEDWPRYNGGTGPTTKGVTIDFRNMLHAIHQGKELANAATYTVAGFNGSSNQYPHVGFPALPGGAKRCDTCHGATSWKEPRRRDHPTQQTSPVLAWRLVCSGCHDSTGARAHMDLNTFNAGQSTAAESCEVCHGIGAGENLQLVHKPR